MVRRVAGASLVLLGAVGILLSSLAGVQVWRTARQVTAVVNDTLFLVSKTLDDLDYSLGVTSETLTGAAIAVDGVYTTSLEISEALDSTRFTVDEMASLAADDLPRSIESSLVALEALEETAAVIDQLLRGFQRLGVGSYDPEIPLDQAVSDTRAGLEPVPSSLHTMAAGLEQTSANLEGVQEGMALMGDHMVGIRENLISAEEAISSHRQTMQQFQEHVRSVDRNVDHPIRTVAWGATILLIWIGLSQLAIIRWGASLWRTGGPNL